MIELTVFGSAVMTVVVLAAVVGLFFLGAWIIDSFDPDFFVFFLMFVFFIVGATAMLLCIPMFWGAGYGGSGG